MLVRYLLLLKIKTNEVVCNIIIAHTQTKVLIQFNNLATKLPFQLGNPNEILI